jgi:hypothetical protein
MSNTFAVLLAATICALIVVDLLFFDTANLLFLSKKLYWMIEYFAFWR